MPHPAKPVAFLATWRFVLSLNRHCAKDANMTLMFAPLASALKDGRAVARPYNRAVGRPMGRPLVIVHTWV
jgi:hypothetical protein